MPYFDRIFFKFLNSEERNTGNRPQETLIDGKLIFENKRDQPLATVATEKPRFGAIVAIFAIGVLRNDNEIQSIVFVIPRNLE